MLRYLLVVYGLGGAWLWWLAVSRGTTRAVLGVALVVITVAVGVVVRRRSRRLHSDHESIPSRAITHVGGGESRWNRTPSARPADPGDLESHLGGGV